MLILCVAHTAAALRDMAWQRDVLAPYRVSLCWDSPLLINYHLMWLTPNKNIRKVVKNGVSSTAGTEELQKSSGTVPAH